MRMYRATSSTFSILRIRVVWQSVGHPLKGMTLDSIRYSLESLIQFRKLTLSPAPSTFLKSTQENSHSSDNTSDPLQINWVAQRTRYHSLS